MKAGSKLRKILTYLAYVFTAILIVFIAVVLHANMTGETNFVFGKAIMWVKTNSMEPDIPARSYILVNKATGKDVKVGDVIVFRSSDPELAGQLNTHRVVEIVNGGTEFITQGDNVQVIDKYTAKAENVVGVYKNNLPVLSFFGRFLATSAGITIMVLLIFAIVISTFLPDFLAFYKERAKKKKIDQLVRAEVEKLKTEHNNIDIKSDEE